MYSISHDDTKKAEAYIFISSSTYAAQCTQMTYEFFFYFYYKIRIHRLLKEETKKLDKFAFAKF